MVHSWLSIFDHSGKNGNDNLDNNKVLLNKSMPIHLHYKGRAEELGVEALWCVKFCYSSIHYLAS